MLVVLLVLGSGFAPAQEKAEPSTSQATEQVPPKRVRVSMGVLQKTIVSRVYPTYPKDAKKKRIQGPVHMTLLISTTGDVESIKLIDGDQQLGEAAMDAIKQWKFKPYVLNGTPVEVETTFTFNFTLSGG
jgi:protein TonB